MIKIEETITPTKVQWEAAISGMHNSMNSWNRSDSGYGCRIDGKEKTCETCSQCELFAEDEVYRKFIVGVNDLALIRDLSLAGSGHREFPRMLTVYADITAPLYWWKEYDTYREGAVASSCSTMYKIHEKEFSLGDFSVEHLISAPLTYEIPGKPVLLNMQAVEMMKVIIGVLNAARYNYLETKDKKYWWQMIQLLPSSYNQKCTVMLNYEVLANIYKSRKGHKLDEWNNFCDWIETLPYSEIITGNTSEK